VNNRGTGVAPRRGGGWQPYFGPSWRPDGSVLFRIWSPSTRSAEVVLAGETLPMTRDAQGVFTASLAGARADLTYRIGLDGDGPFPDPWSRWQPEGVHGPSALLARGHAVVHRPVPRLRSQATYEMHIGTFSAGGDYAGARRRLDSLAALGVDTVQVMPLSEWPGRWNWGYDGTYFHAPTRAYGTPAELRQFVAAAHARGLSVLVDAVFNHLGPDGAYIYRFAPEFFTERFKTPWGGAIDYSRKQVRRTIADAARWWIQEYGFDGLRLDATHAIYDGSSTHILSDIAAAARRAYRGAYVVAEDHRNESRLVTEDNLDAILADDFHHSVRVALSGQQDGYFKHYRGNAAEIATALRDGWIHQGRRKGVMGPGSPTDGIDAAGFVFCIENHDQVGNRADGLHLAGLVSPEAYRAASALLLLAPERVLLFQGQDWASARKFNFFTDHHAELGRLVTEGRRNEFRHFSAYREHPELIADPQSESTFLASRLDPAEARGNAWCLRLYKRLLTRNQDPVFRRPDRHSMSITTVGSLLLIERRHAGERRLVAVTLTGEKGAAIPPGKILLHTEERRFGGRGRPTLEIPAAVVVDPDR